MRKIIFMAMVSLLLAAHPGLVAAGVFSPYRFILENGLEVLVVSNHRSPVVTQMLWYKVGSIDEPAGKSGIAHLLEHLMFKGTKKFPDGAFSKMVALNGGNENAFTSLDYTGYHQTVSSDRLEMVMDLESDRMSNLILDEADVKTETGVILEERRQRIENNPAARLMLEINRELFAGHPYHRPIIGWNDEITTITAAELEKFYREYYSPANAVLVIVGDVTPAKAKTLAEKYYAPIPAQPVPARPPLQLGENTGKNSITLRDEYVSQPSWALHMAAPSLSTAPHSIVTALEVLEELVGGGSTSRLYRAMVVDGAVAVSAGASYSGRALGPGRFVLYASPRPGRTTAEMAAAATRELGRIAGGDIDEDELARVKKRLLAGAIYARDNLKTPGWSLGGAMVAGHGLESVEEWPERIGQVTVADLVNAAKALMSETRRVEAHLLPPAPVSGSGEGGK